MGGLPQGVRLLEDSAFVTERVIGPLASAGRVGGSGAYTLRFVDTADVTKVTAECRLQDGDTLFVKVYSGEEDDANCHAVMSALWQAGFSDPASYRIPEPLAYLPEHRILVMREARGVTLFDELRAGHGSGAGAGDEGVRQAARWLAHLHTSTVRVGLPWTVWRNLARLSRRLTRAAAANPDWVVRLNGMLQRLFDLAEQAERPSRLVQTHGQFRDVHVYLDGETATVIDLDRSRPADPARDVDEFLHRLRWKNFKYSSTCPEALTDVFLEEYTAHVPLGQLTNLTFYAAAHALSSLARYLRKREPDDKGWKGAVAFHGGEFETALAGRFGRWS
ncbi:MAG: phosphotransferase family protein [Nitriliruptorales bacterium]